MYLVGGKLEVGKTENILLTGDLIGDFWLDFVKHQTWPYRNWQATGQPHDYFELSVWCVNFSPNTSVQICPFPNKMKKW